MNIFDDPRDAARKPRAELDDYDRTRAPRAITIVAPAEAAEQVAALMRSVPGALVWEQRA